MQRADQYGAIACAQKLGIVVDAGSTNQRALSQRYNTARVTRSATPQMIHQCLILRGQKHLETARRNSDIRAHPAHPTHPTHPAHPAHPAHPTALRAPRHQSEQAAALVYPSRPHQVMILSDGHRARR